MPRFHNKSEKYVILWDDIIAAFKNPIHARNGDTVVPFLMDADFALIQPLRFSVYPDVVLDVVVGTTGTEEDPEYIRYRHSRTSSSSSTLFTAPSSQPLSETELPIIDGYPKTTSRVHSAKREPQDHNESLENTSIPAADAVGIEEDRYRPSSSSSTLFTAPNSQALSDAELPIIGAYSKKNSKKTRTRRAKREPQGHSEFQENTSPLEIQHDRAPQLVPESQGNRSGHSDLLEFILEEWYSYGLDSGIQDINKNYIHGLAYYEGKGVRQDYAKTLDLFLRAAGQGHAGAQYRLLVMKGNRHTIRSDYSKVAEWYKTAAELGYPDAETGLGFIFEVGFGVTQDYSKAVELYGKAAEQEHAYAYCSLGFMYENGYGIPKDYSKAVELYRKAAFKGLAKAQHSLGNMLYYGYGVAENRLAAAELCQKAADQGYVPAQCDLGLMYMKGDVIPKDYPKAAELLRITANQGYAEGQYNLGIMYKNGNGVPKNLYKAIDCWEKAATQG
ncbi:hypothetical protein BGX21_008866, partial [Mortierella sp. AD011]